MGVGNHLFPDIVADQPAGAVHAIFGGVPRPIPRGVLDSPPYAYLEAVSLVLATLMLQQVLAQPQWSAATAV